MTSLPFEGVPAFTTFNERSGSLGAMCSDRNHELASQLAVRPAMPKACRFALSHFTVRSHLRLFSIRHTLCSEPSYGCFPFVSRFGSNFEQSDSHALALCGYGERVWCTLHSVMSAFSPADKSEIFQR